VAHAASASGLPPLGLHRPIVVTKALRRVSTLRAYSLLDVERRAATTPTECVGLVVPFTKARRTLRL